MVTTTLRIDQVTYDTLVKNAMKDKRSINKEILFIIESYIDMTTWYHKK